MRLRLSRAFDDVPPVSTDDELLQWSAQLLEGPERIRVRRVIAREPEKPEPAPIDLSRRVSDEELFREIADRATEVADRNRIRSNRRAVAAVA